MLVSNTAQRLQYLMNERNLKQSDILRKCEPYCKQFEVRMNRADISQYLSSKASPRQDKLTVLGFALGVSEAWLMGYDVPMSRENQETHDKHNDTELAKEFIFDLSMINRWKDEVGEVGFSDSEITEIINFAKYVISKRGVK